MSGLSIHLISIIIIIAMSAASELGDIDTSPITIIRDSLIGRALYTQRMTLSTHRALTSSARKNNTADAIVYTPPPNKNPEPTQTRRLVVFCVHRRVKSITVNWVVFFSAFEKFVKMTCARRLNSNFCVYINSYVHALAMRLYR